MLSVDIAARLGDFELEARFEAPASGVTALFGRSGAGKTSLTNILAGLARPSRGRIALGDRVLFDAAKRVNVPPDKRQIGYIFQEGRLFPHKTVRANLAYGLGRLAPEQRAARFDEVVDLLGITPLLERRPKTLSGGEKQRVAIGRALLSGPDLLLMDEPLTALDAARRAEILPYVEHLRDVERLPIIWVSHDVDEIIRLADHLVLIDQGRVTASGPLIEIINGPDFRAATGRREDGTVIETTVAAKDAANALTHLRFPGGELRVPGVNVTLGQRLRVHIMAKDVAIALDPPRGISVLNCLAGRIVGISDPDGADVDVEIDVGVRLRARITRYSARLLALEEGQTVHALIKAMALDRTGRDGLGMPGG